MAGNWQGFTFADPTEDWQRQFNQYQAQSPGMGFNFANASRQTALPPGISPNDPRAGAYMKSGLGGMEQLAHALQGAGFDTGTTDAIRNLYGSSGSTAENAARQLGVDQSQFGANAGTYAVRNGQLFGPGGVPIGAAGGGAMDPSTGQQYRSSAQADPTWGAGNSTWGQFGNPADPNGGGGAGPASGGAAPPPSGGGGYPPYGGGGGGGGGMGAPGSGLQPIQPPDSSNNYALDIGKYLDPGMQFAQEEGMRALNSSGAAAGQTFSGDTLRNIMKFGQGLGFQNYNQAAQQAAQQQGFGRGVDVSNTQLGQSQQGINNALGIANAQLGQSQQGINNALGEFNQQFGYNAQQQDQQTAFQQLMQMAQMGLGATGGQSNLASTLATLLGGNLSTLGQIQGTGTIGGNNAITNAISQILGNLNSNNMMSQLFGNRGTT